MPLTKPSPQDRPKPTDADVVLAKRLTEAAISRRLTSSYDVAAAWDSMFPESMALAQTTWLRWTRLSGAPPAVPRGVWIAPLAKFCNGHPSKMTVDDMHHMVTEAKKANIARRPPPAPTSGPSTYARLIATQDAILEELQAIRTRLDALEVVRGAK